MRILVNKILDGVMEKFTYTLIYTSLWQSTFNMILVIRVYLFKKTFNLLHLLFPTWQKQYMNKVIVFIQ